jgi:hypothetical protein
MSHNRRTLQEEELSVLRRQPARLNGGLGVRTRSAATPAIDAGFLSAGRFAVGGIHPGSLRLTLPQPVRNNKTIGLVAWEGAAANGN